MTVTTRRMQYVHTMYNILHKVRYLLDSIGFQTQWLCMCDCVLSCSGVGRAHQRHGERCWKWTNSQMCCCGEAFTMDTLAEGRLFGEYCFICWGKPIWEPQIVLYQVIMCVMLHFFLFFSTAKESWSSPVSRLRIRGCISVLLRMNGGASTPAPSFVSSVSF